MAISSSAATSMHPDVVNLTPEEFKRMLRAKHIKKQSQMNQQRYRARSKEKFLALQAEVEEQKNRVQRMLEYYDLIYQKKLLQQAGVVQFRGLVLHSYLDLFRFSVANSADSLFEKQRLFLQLNWHEEFKLTPEHVAGYKPVLQQWQLVSDVSENYSSKKMTIERIDGEGQVFRARMSVELTVKPKSVRVLYPHMISEPDFLYKVVGKQLTFNSTMTFRFGENNQITSLLIENDLASGWMRILKDPILTARVLGQAMFKESTIVQER